MYCTCIDVLCYYGEYIIRVITIVMCVGINIPIRAYTIFSVTCCMIYYYVAKITGNMRSTTVKKDTLR